MSKGTVAGKRKILVLGGGINGAAIARELLLNGVSVVLVDAADIAGGATSCSSRLIHGGLRYLEFGEFDLVRESLDERRRLLRLAPHLVRPLRLFIPVGTRFGGWRSAAWRFCGFSARGKHRQQRRGLWVVRAGLWLYERMAGGSSLARANVHRVGDADAPEVDPGRFRWMCSYGDGQVVFPERFVVALLEDARRLSQQHDVELDVYTYHRATLAGDVVEIREELSTESAKGGGEPVARFQPRAIVNATGAWVDSTLAQLGAPSRRLIGGTKGSHLLTANDQLAGLLGGQGVYAEAADGRPVFVLPLDDWTLVGTTDLPFDDAPETATASDDELDYLLNAVNSVFAELGLTQSDVDWSYSGVRPLPYVGAKTPAAITRRHQIEEDTAGDVPLFSVIGGKLTTCRSLAEQTCAKVLRSLGEEVARDSRRRPLPGGGDDLPGEDEPPSAQQNLAETLGFTVDQVRAVWRLCGSDAAEMLAPDVSESGASRDCLEGVGLPVCFVRRVIQREWVRRLGDVVERRLMLLYHRELSMSTLRHLARIMAEEGKLAASDVDEEVDLCRERLTRHFGRRLPDE